MQPTRGSFRIQNPDDQPRVNPSGTTRTGAYLPSRNFNTDSGAATCGDSEGLRAAAVAPADPYVNFQNGSRILIVPPPDGASNWSGLGSLGCRNHSTPDGTIAVSIRMTMSGGGKTTTKATTGVDGTAVWTYKVGRRDPPSACQVSATAKHGGQTASSNAPATFRVE